MDSGKKLAFALIPGHAEALQNEAQNAGDLLLNNLVSRVIDMRNNLYTGALISFMGFASAFPPDRVSGGAKIARVIFGLALCACSAKYMHNVGKQLSTRLSFIQDLLKRDPAESVNRFIRCQNEKNAFLASIRTRKATG